ncbi:hypothetical protein RR46_10045 [Papilio xuthus]|uniref:Uncharacterized protein n=1 Tax=Papilio xuthus TaxID=66420 RepID=A0A194PZG9_PAPXU|nr:hypothetical protein RR46_10045 [Papilio xuthus]
MADMLIYKVATLILLGALSKGDLPEDDFRIINRQDLLATDSDMFEDKEARAFTQLLFDVARDQVIVGARLVTKIIFTVIIVYYCNLL